jgi:hypothetical protein
MILRKSQLFLWLWAVAYLLLNSGCHLQKTHVSDKKTPPPKVEKVVVVGFQAAMSRGEKADVVRDPLTGAIFMAEPVDYEVVGRINEILFASLVEDKRYDLISPGQAKGVFSSIVYSDLNVGMDPVKILQEVGKAFEADAVLAGHIYRWREREGTDYAVNRPASVAFNLHLVRPTDGAILWKGKFDKTQRSLFENLFDLATFFRGGGRWMTAKELAMPGLERLLVEMPAGAR